MRAGGRLPPVGGGRPGVGKAAEIRDIWARQAVLAGHLSNEINTTTGDIGSRGVGRGWSFSVLMGCWPVWSGAQARPEIT